MNFFHFLPAFLLCFFSPSGSFQIWKPHSRYTTIRLAQSFLQDDRAVHELIMSERARQVSGLELIASENFVSKDVMEAVGSCLTNKYSEGQPNARYYGGNQFIDKLELLCQDRALSLFSVDPKKWSVNVQSYSGSIANLAVYTGLLKPGERLMGLDLPSGGHLTHGYQTAKRKVSASALFFESKPYRVHSETGLIDYDEMEILATEYTPKLLIAGASSYPRDWNYERMKEIADSVGAYLMADISHIAGLVATNNCNSPFKYCDVITTTTHKSLRGPRGAMIFSKNATISNLINLAVFPALQGGPHDNVIAGIAVALKEASSESFPNYIRQVKLNAAALAQQLKKFGYKIITDGTDNHIVLWDVRPTGLSAAVIEKLCEMCDISVNKNSIIGDTSAMNPGGIRLGSLAMTTRKMKETEMLEIANYLNAVVNVGKSFLLSQEEPVRLVTLLEFMQSSKSEKMKSEMELIRRSVNDFTCSFPFPS
jgi:glycine hydroxymethyltransferase